MTTWVMSARHALFEAVDETSELGMPQYVTQACAYVRLGYAHACTHALRRMTHSWQVQELDNCAVLRARLLFFIFPRPLSLWPP